MENIMLAMRQDCPLEDTAVTTFWGPVPLQDYIAGIPGQSEADAFFTDNGPFSLFYMFPLLLERFGKRAGMSEEGTKRIQERFNAYTWSETPEARDCYYRARRHAGYISDYQYDLQRSPGLGMSIGKLLGRDEFSGCPSTCELRKIYEDISRAEDRFKEMPGVPILRRVVPGRGVQSQKRLGAMRDLSRRLKREARLSTEPMKSLGREYREMYLQKYAAGQLTLF